MIRYTCILLLICCLYLNWGPVAPVRALADTSAAEGPVIPTIPGLVQKKIPDNDAMRLLQDMRIGWNLGNTFDAHADNFRGNEMDLEKYWCGVITPRAAIEAIHQAGFNTLRLPVSWHNHVDADYRISAQWLDRVQEVADWALDLGMYVILNIHHDDSVKYLYPTSEHYENSERYVTAIWSQLAERFKDYGSHLIFESMNEPRPKGTAQEWSFNSADPFCVDVADCLNRLNQAFVDTVRQSGGQNAERYLMIPAYAANADAALATDHYHLPRDTAENRLIVSVHAYTPYNFALQLPGISTFSITNAGQYGELLNLFNRLYDTYIKNGVPVVIGEFGAVDKNNLQDRVNFYACYVAVAHSRGIPVNVWDNHGFAGGGELFGLLDRRTATFPKPILVDAMMSGLN